MDLRVGKHCAVEGCHQLDFLPFVCVSCHLNFCLEHRACAAHECTEAAADRVAPDCPKCGRPVPLLPGEDAQRALKAHIDARCATRKTVPDAPKCGAPGCTVRHNHTPVACTRCRGVFCVQHRVPEDHACPRAAPVAHRARPSSAVSSVRPAALVPAQVRAELTAPSMHRDDVFTVRLWLAALRDSHPAAVAATQQPLLVNLNRRWSVGKAVDWICGQLGIQADGGQRFRLVTLHQAQVVPNSLVLNQSGRLNNDGTQAPDLKHVAGVALVPESLLSEASLQKLAAEVQAASPALLQAGRRCAEEVRALIGNLFSFRATARVQ